MKLFRQALIILGIYLCGEFISSTFNIPIPGNIIGMVILFVLLYTKVVNIDQIKEVSNFLLDHLAFFFIPAGVGLIASFGVIKSSWMQILAVCVITTVIIIGVTGRIVQGISSREAVDKKEGVALDNNN